MTNIELRWLIPEEQQDSRPTLQWRELVEPYEFGDERIRAWGPWETVPFVIAPPTVY